MLDDNLFTLPLPAPSHESSHKQTKLSDEGQLLAEVIKYAKTTSKEREKALKGKTYRVSSIGGTISNVYEKIRNSAEYTEEHLLLQRAIRRYLRRNLFVGGSVGKSQLVEEMIVELTQSGYIPNDSVSNVQVNELNRLIKSLYDIFQATKRLGVPAKKAQSWFLDTLSVECEWLFHDPSNLFAYAHFCHQHVMRHAGQPDSAEMSSSDRSHKSDLYFIYYLAVLKNLLKADIATMRAVLAWAYQIPQTSHELKQFNERFDRLLLSAEMKHANVMVNRRGAPLRIIRSSFFDGAGQDGSVLHDQSALVALIGQNTEHNYVMAQHKLNSGIIKSIIFLVITKVIIGLGIEIPLDIWLYGSVIYLPLMINLLSPPLFMLFQRLTLRMPKRRNTVAIQDYVKDMLYIDEDSQPLKSLQKSLGNSSGSRIFGWIYALFTLLTFGLVTYFLAVTGFNPIQGMIFFVFMSTATFLSFRLSLIIKDIELVSTNQNALSTIRDFVYIPFILLGQWLSGKYAQINIISTLLDLVIELPLKKVLRLTRQWVRFLEDKKETIV